MPVEHRIATTTHGSFLVEMPAAGSAVGVLVGFHGYGETAADHLEALKGIPGTERWCLCAVEGLHLFYRQRTGEVVASWMTKRHRELAIEDNRAYVQRIIARLRAEVGEVPVALSGFSQGVAMAYRAASHAQTPLAGLVLLAGDVPPDLADQELAALPPILLGRGTGDPWYNEAKMAADLERLQGAGVEVEPHVFDGGHEWTSEFRTEAGAALRRLSSS